MVLSCSWDGVELVLYILVSHPYYIGAWCCTGTTLVQHGNCIGTAFVRYLFYTRNARAVHVYRTCPPGPTTTTTTPVLYCYRYWHDIGAVLQLHWFVPLSTVLVLVWY